MKRIPVTLAILAGLAAASPLAFAQSEGEGQGQAIVTLLPKQNTAPAPAVSEQSIHVQVDGKPGQITDWHAFQGSNAAVELVILIDDGARSSLGREMGDITHFVQSLPPNVKAAFAWMENGRAVLSTPLSADHAKVLQGLHLPVSAPGYNASPYFCLSDLAKNWPSDDPAARREVIMISDGVDYYEMRYDPDDPYVRTAIEDSARARLVVYSIYWRSAGRADRSWYENDAGQNLLLEVAQATGGNSYWMGMGNPVSLQPYFDDFSRRLNNQYELGFTAPLRGNPQVEDLKVKITAPGTQVTAPQNVFVTTAPVNAPH